MPDTPISLLAEYVSPRVGDYLPIVDSQNKETKKIDFSSLSGNRYDVTHYGLKGDGSTDDRVSLEALIASLTGPAVLYFPPGRSYKWTGVNGVSVANKSDITFYGYGATFLGGSTVTDRTFTFTNCDRIKILGFKFDRKHSASIGIINYGCIYFDCNECEIIDCDGYDVNILMNVLQVTTGSSLNSVSNCTLTARVPVTLSNLNNNLLPNYMLIVNTGSLNVGNTCKNNRIFGGACMISMPGSIGSAATGNTVIDCRESAIYFLDCVDGVAAGNTIIRAGKSGIKAISTAGLNIGCKNITVSGNVIHGCGLIVTNSPDHIQFQEVEGGVISGNTIRLYDASLRTNDQLGIVVKGSKSIGISGNTIFCTDPGYNDKGISIYNGGISNVDSVTVSGNTITGIIFPVYILNDTPAMTVTDVNIRNNTLKSSAGSICCVRLADNNNGMKNITVNGNEITHKGLSSGAIYSSGALKQTRIKYNHFICDVSGSFSPIYAIGNQTGPIVVEGNSSSGIETNFTSIADKQNWVLRDNWDKNGLNVDFAYSFTANNVVDGFRTGGHFDNAGATGAVAFTLPPAKTGMEYLFETVVAQTISINGDGTENISVAGAQKATWTSDGTSGEFMHIKCVVDGVWHATLNSAGWV